MAAAVPALHRLLLRGTQVCRPRVEIVRRWLASSGHSSGSRPPRPRPRTPLEMMADDLNDSNIMSSQTGGLDAGIAGLNETSAFEAMAERAIQQAAQEGAFERLAGRGRPIDLDSRPSLEGEEALAAKVMKNAGVLPEWLEEEQRLRARMEALRAWLRDGREGVEAECQAINAQIKLYNLRCPPQLQKPLLSLQAEREAVARSRS